MTLPGYVKIGGGGNRTHLFKGEEMKYNSWKPRKRAPRKMKKLLKKLNLWVTKEYNLPF